MRVTLDSPFARYARVFLDGEDITKTCYEADDTEGYAMCYDVSQQGEDLQPAKVRRVGQVAIKLVSPTAWIADLWERERALAAKRQALLATLRGLQASGDFERSHAAADQALLGYIGDPEISEAYEGITRWCA